MTKQTDLQQKHKMTNTFHKHVENLINITFTNDEKQLLNKGLKYNLHYKHKNGIKTLAIKVDTAINQLNETEQIYETNSSK
jgi:hypothetical protein